MWAQILNTLLGVWLMCAPALLHYGGMGKNHDQILGPLVATFAFIAIWELERQVRRVNFFLGCWLILTAPLFHHSTASVWNAAITGSLILGFSLIKGAYRPERYGGGWASLWKD